MQFWHVYHKMCPFLCSTDSVVQFNILSRILLGWGQFVFEQFHRVTCFFEIVFKCRQVLLLILIAFWRPENFMPASWMTWPPPAPSVWQPLFAQQTFCQWLLRVLHGHLLAPPDHSNTYIETQIITIIVVPWHWADKTNKCWGWQKYLRNPYCPTVIGGGSPVEVTMTVLCEKYIHCIYVFGVGSL